MFLKFIPYIRQGVETIDTSFEYCSELLSLTEYNAEMAKVLCQVAQCTQIVNDKSGWIISTASQLKASTMFLREMEQQPESLVSLLMNFDWLNEIPLQELKSALKVIGEKFVGELKLALHNSYYNFNPVDDALLSLQGSR